MRRRDLLPALTALAFPSLWPARGRAQAALLAVASFSILGDIVRQIAGTRAHVAVIAGPNADAHTFQPRPSDAAALRNAALVVRNGLGFDPWIDRMIRAAGYRGPVAVASQGVAPRSMEGHDHGHDHGHGGGAGRRQPHSVGPRLVPDPHAWQDPRNGALYARNITAALAAADPVSADAYRVAGEAYAARILALDGWIREQVATVPEAKRVVVTSHDAFGYFGAAFGIRFLAPQGISTASEPSAAQVAQLIRQIRADGITAVFIENMTNPVTLQRLSREAGVRVHGELFSDSLSEPEGPAPTYEAMFRHNVGLLVPAMKGEAA